MNPYSTPLFHRLPGVLVLAWGLCAASAAQAADGCVNQAAVMPPASLEAPGIGGTGKQALQPGMGGTGIDGGVGGTGIVGVITGFASVCVNGVEVHFDTTTPVSEDGKPVPINTLAVGKLVSIQATGQGAQFTARSIAVMNAVVGPVEAVNTKWGELQVLGQTVVAPSAAAVAGIKPGQWVQVGGYRRAGGAIEASYIGVVPAQPRAQLTGLFERNMGVDAVVSGTDVRLVRTKLPDSVGRGSEVTVTGEWDGRTLRATSLEAEPTQRSLGAAREVLVEGLVRAVGARSISLGQHSLGLDRNLQVQGGRLQDLAVNQRVRVFGRVDDGNRIAVHRIEIREGGRRSGSGTTSGEGTRRSGSDDASAEDRSGEDRSGRQESGGSGKDSSSSDSTSKTSESSGGSGSSGGSSSSGSSGGSSGSGGSGGSGKGGRGK